MKKRFYTSGVCSQAIDFEINEQGLVTGVVFHGGCNGNTQGIARLVEGMPATEVIERLKGIDCNGKGTSCPDQLALALSLSLKK